MYVCKTNSCLQPANKTTPYKIFGNRRLWSYIIGIVRCHRNVHKKCFRLHQSNLYSSCIIVSQKTYSRTKHEIDWMTHCRHMAMWNFRHVWLSAILDFVQPQVAPLDPPTPKTLPRTNHEEDHTIHWLRYDHLKYSRRPPAIIWNLVQPEKNPNQSGATLCEQSLTNRLKLADP